MDAYGWLKTLCLKADEGRSEAKERIVEYDSTLLARMPHLLVCEVGQGEEKRGEEADQDDALCCPDKLSLLEES